MKFKFFKSKDIQKQTIILSFFISVFFSNLVFSSSEEEKKISTCSYVRFDLFRSIITEIVDCKEKKNESGSLSNLDFLESYKLFLDQFRLSNWVDLPSIPLSSEIKKKIEGLLLMPQEKLFSDKNHFDLTNVVGYINGSTFLSMLKQVSEVYSTCLKCPYFSKMKFFLGIKSQRKAIPSVESKEKIISYLEYFLARSLTEEEILLVDTHRETEEGLAQLIIHFFDTEKKINLFYHDEDKKIKKLGDFVATIEENKKIIFFIDSLFGPLMMQKIDNEYMSLNFSEKKYKNIYFFVLNFEKTPFDNSQEQKELKKIKIAIAILDSILE